MEVSVQHTCGQPNFRVTASQAAQLADHSLPVFRSENLVSGFSNLGSEEADPDALHLGTPAPEVHELRDITRPAGHLPGYCAMHHDPPALDMRQNSLVGCRFSANVVLGLETVDRYDDLHLLKLRPFDRDGSYGAGYNFDVHVLIAESRNEDRQFPIPNERFSADEKDEQRAVLCNQGQDAADQILSCVFSNLFERSAPHVVRLVGITARTGKGAAVRDLY